MTNPMTPPLWLTDTPSFMPAELADQLTYAQWQELYERGEAPGQVARSDLADEVGFTELQAISFLRGEVPTGLTADAAEHTGAMIALVPSDADLDRLVVPGGEPRDELHLTICYLGEAAKIPPFMRVRLLDAMYRVGQMTPVVDATGFGVAVWNGANIETPTAVVLNVSGGELEDVYEDVWNSLQHAFDDADDIPEQYEPWVPHVCLAYSDNAGLVALLQNREGPIQFTKLRVAFAGRVTDIPLYDGSDLTSPGDSQMSEDSYEDNLAAAGKKESDVNLPGGNHNLKNYWTKGAGAAKIRWGTDGSFSRCVSQLGKYVKNPQGLCAEYHKAATGEWPTEGGKNGIPSAADIGIAFDTPRYMRDFTPDTIIADATAVADADVDLEYDGSWEGVLAVEDVDTGDQRRFAAGSITWVNPRDVVAPLQWAPQNLGEHKGSVTVGRIDQIWRDATNPRVIRGRGRFDLESDEGAEAFRKVKDGFLSGISIDPDQVTDADVELIYPTALTETKSDGGDLAFTRPELTVYHAGRIRGATLVAFPAFIEGAIQLTKRDAVTASVSTAPWRAARHELALGDEIDGLVASAAFAFVREYDEVVDRRNCRFLHHEIDPDTGEVGPANLTACTQHIDAINAGRTFGLGADELFESYQHLAAHLYDAGQTPAAFALEREVIVASVPSEPPLEWFVDPKLSGPTPVIVTEDGRVYGHAAVWGTCHTGYADRCVTPPSEPDYSFFTTGEVMTAGGHRVAVGQITLGTSHAPTTGLSVARAVDHYGDTGTAVADVAAGMDAHGIWVAGSVRPGTADVLVAALRASALSGDWRRIGGQLRMVALLAVNVPGFPIPRVTTAMQDDRQVTLVAAGILNREQIDESAVNFDTEVLKLAGSCGIPLGNMPKRKKKMNYATLGLDELVALVNGA
jgi:hypothetical protein